VPPATLEHAEIDLRPKDEETDTLLGQPIEDAVDAGGLADSRRAEDRQVTADGAERDTHRAPQASRGSLVWTDRRLVPDHKQIVRV
jgi:hypothetical protein